MARRMLIASCFVEPEALAFGSSGPLLAEHLQSLACIVYELVAQPLPCCSRSSRELASCKALGIGVCALLANQEL